MIEELISRCFQARDEAHIQHLMTTSFAVHSALHTFYSDVIETVDTLVENYIGTFGEIGDIPQAELADTTDIRNFLQEEADWIESNRDEISNGSNSIGALVDDLVTVYTHAIYRLGLK